MRELKRQNLPSLLKEWRFFLPVRSFSRAGSLSHIRSSVNTKQANNPERLWERVCLRRGPKDHHKTCSLKGFCGEGACSRWAAKRPQNHSTQLHQVDRMYRVYDCCAAEREQAPSPQGAAFDLRLQGRVSLQFQTVQRPTHRQFTKHDELRDAQYRIALRPLQKSGAVTGDHLGRGKGLAGIGQ